MIKKIFLKIIRIYQDFISPNLGVTCRFYPSCSEYSFQTLEKHGLFKGLFFSVKRLLKCNPWHKGGVDLPL